jgi:membrane associated rhomboid family serine protease
MKGLYFSPVSKGGFFGSLSLTLKLILFNVFIFIISIVLFGIYGEDFFLSNLALTPSLILQGRNLWTILTSMFFHASFFHLFANMFSLFFIGNFLEKIIGRKRFFLVYIFSGIVGGIFYVGASFLLGNLDLPAVGASGAIFGLLGVLAVLVPLAKIYLIVGPLIVIVIQVILGGVLSSTFVPILNLIVNVLIIFMIFSLFSFRSSFRKFALPLELPMWLVPIIAIVPLSIISFFIPLPIGNSAHFGGLLVGVIYGFWLRKRFPNKTNRISNYFR